MGRTVTKSIAIIGEGETEWFYFDSLRIACRYPFKVAPDFPQHSDINHILKLVESYLSKQYDYIVCCSIWIDYFCFLLKCSSTSEQRRNTARKSMPGECYSLKRTHAQNFGSCSTSFPMWFVGDMKTMTSYSPNYRSTCRAMKRPNGTSHAPTSTSI